MGDVVTVTRAFTGELDVARAGDGDGLTVEGIVVPYDEPAEVCDDHGPTPVYREVWTAASFARQLQGIAAGRREVAPDTIAFTLGHRTELEREIGYAVELTSVEGAGLRTVFRLNGAHRAIDQIRGMLAESHRGLSVEALLLKSRVRRDGAVERVAAVLRAVAAVPAGAFAGARITAMREADQAAAFGTWVAPTPALDAVAASWGFDKP